jgi:hypothetical protein
MKANNGTGNTPDRDTWETPQWLFDILDKQYSFDLDCCASGKNSKCSMWTSDFEDFMKERLDVKAWMNPPFSKAKQMFEHFFKVTFEGVAIYRCDNLETEIWQKVILPNATWIFIPNKRIAYEGMNGSGSRFPSALIGYNVPEPIMLQGTLLRVKRDDTATTTTARV